MVEPGAAPYVMSVATIDDVKDTIMNPGWSIQNGFFPMAKSRMAPPPFAVMIPARTAGVVEYPAASARRVPLIAKTIVAK